MFVVPSHPHLRGLKIVVAYRELVETPPFIPGPGKWKGDPGYDPADPFMPPPKEYVNGIEIAQEKYRTQISNTPFPVERAVRRGLTKVHPHESDYYELARQQGLYHLLPENQGPSDKDAGTTAPRTNGITPPDSENSKSINGSISDAGTSLHPNGDILGVDELHDTNMETTS